MYSEAHRAMKGRPGPEPGFKPDHVLTRAEASRGGKRSAQNKTPRERIEKARRANQARLAKQRAAQATDAQTSDEGARA